MRRMITPVGYRRTDPSETPTLASPDYLSTRKRAPAYPPIRIEHTLSEITGPSNHTIVTPGEADLTHCAGGEAIGERIIVAGHVLDSDGHPLPGVLIEVWQANAAGRYAHEIDQHDAPLDPHFVGVGRVITDARGAYSFTTIKPGAYPWGNHRNAWRPAHIHYSLLGPAFATRLITQMYFPGDPLLALDPIFNSVADPLARQRMVAVFDLTTTIEGRALGYRFDFVLRGREPGTAERSRGAER
jgi:protocatechuate 3,4-dioxygenase, beta subunit